MKRKIDFAFDLQEALQRRAEGARLTAAEKAQIEAQIKAFCGELGKSESDFPEGQLMTDDAYVQILEDIDKQITQQLKTLTREAMKRAKLDRLRIESTQ
ncbi:hypothetical protein D3C71_1753280 [compost metagenome]